jgi:hypothetical protein
MKTHAQGIPIMSRICRISLTPTALPGPAMLQASIQALGYKLDLEGLNLLGTNGFHGCVLDGEDAGFTLTQDADGITLRWSSDPREHCAALMLAAALQSCGAAQISLGAGAPLDAKTLQTRISEVLDEI